jgi:hypothetical protein
LKLVVAVVEGMELKARAEPAPGAEQLPAVVLATAGMDNLVPEAAEAEVCTAHILTQAMADLAAFTYNIKQQAHFLLVGILQLLATQEPRG